MERNGNWRHRNGREWGCKYLFQVRSAESLCISLLSFFLIRRNGRHYKQHAVHKLIFAYLTIKVCVQPRPLPVNMTLPAVAAERRRLLSIGIFCRGALSNKPAACRCRSIGQTDGRTLDRFIDPVPHTIRALSVRTVLNARVCDKIRQNIANICVN